MDISFGNMGGTILGGGTIMLGPVGDPPPPGPCFFALFC
jgi:hypothetical protein